MEIDFEKVAQGIEAGTVLRPVQSTYGYFGFDFETGKADSSCALGALVEGLVGLQDVRIDEDNYVERMDALLEKEFGPFFFVMWVPAPAEAVAACGGHEDNVGALGFGIMITHLNDQHHWSREMIAAWVRTLAK